MATPSLVKSPALKTLASSLALLAAWQGLAACVPLVLTAVTVTAVEVSQDRRTPGKYLDDNLLEVRLRNAIGQDQNLGREVNISVTSFNGIVLLTGEVNTDEQRQRAGEIVQSDSETRKLVNELELAGKTSVVGRINDSWLTGKVKATLFKTENLASKIKVVTEHGKVYLLGLVTRAEADAAVDAVRSVGGVTHIVKVFEYIE